MEGALMGIGYEYCARCSDFRHNNQHGHTCHPEWEIWTEDDCREGALTVRTATAEQAAEKWGEIYDNGDYTIIGGDPETVLVARAGADPVKFSVSAEAVATYYATEI